MDTISSLIRQVDQEELAANLFHLAKDPLPCRTLNLTLPGHTKSTLHEADDFIQGKLESWGYQVGREAVRVQAFRTDTSKPMPHQFGRPEPSDPWYEAYNLYAKKTGHSLPNEVIIVLSHKDSQSWIDRGAGANDNAAGTVGNMEIARILSEYASQRSLWFVFCNEEHRPWTSVTAAQNTANSGVDVVAVLNIDSIGSKSLQDRREGRMVSVARYTTAEGETLADLIAVLNGRYAIGLEQTKYRNERPANDEGSFIRAGIPAAIHITGSAPNASPHYHSRDDIPEHVDLLNVSMATQLSLTAVVHLDTRSR
jgi:hypothetical protein